MRKLLIVALLLQVSPMLFGEGAGDERCLSAMAPRGDDAAKPERHFGRARPVDIEHIRLELNVDVAGERIQGAAAHTLTPVGQPVRQITFDSVGLDIQKVVLNGSTPLEFSTTNDTIEMYLPEPAPAGTPLTLTIEYEVVRPERGMHFRTERMGYTPEEVQCWTQGEAEDARYWFPCFDAPNERATTEVRATVDEGYMALSNGDRVEDAGAAPVGKAVWHWKLAEPHATYLVSLAVGRFTEIADHGGGVPLYYYVAPGREEDARRSFSNTPAMMSLFQTALGVPYPYSRYSQVAVVDFIAGGMENTSITTLMDRTLHDEAAHLTYTSDGLVAHELAHQWFGDLVTCRDWSNLWLNEGFATFLALYFMQQHLGEDEFRNQLFSNQQEVMAEDTGDARAAIVRKVYARPMDLFDVRVYEKGGGVLQMLRQRVGEDLFWKSLKAYLETHRNQPVDTSDLVRAFEFTTGDGLEQFFHQWVYSGGYPELTVEYTWLAETSVAEVSVKQTQRVDEKTPLFRLETSLLFHGEAGEHLEPIVISEGEQVFHVRLDKRPDFVCFDPAGDLLAKVTFKKPKEMLLKQLEGSTTLAGKYEACEQISRLAEDDALEALKKTLGNAEFWGLRAFAAKALGDMDHPLAVPALAEAVEESHAKVRLAIAEALSKSTTPEAREALEQLATDESPYVAARAIAALGEQRHPIGDAVVEAGLQRESHQQVVRGATLEAIAAVRGEDGIAAIAPYMLPDKDRRTRAQAIAALGKAGQWMKEKTAVREQLEVLLEEPNESLRRQARDALVTLGDPAGVDALERLGRTEKDPEEKQAAVDAVKRLREQTAQTGEVKDLREEVRKLKEQNEDFEQKLKRIEGLVGEIGKKPPAE